MNWKALSIGMLILAAITAGWFLWVPANQSHMAELDGTDIVIPALEGPAVEGEVLFADNCAACHGKYATGTDQGPPFIHPIYVSSHHGDRAFHVAVRNGVQGHHWPFGDMPPVETVGEDDVEKMIAFVRALQRANGIN